MTGSITQKITFGFCAFMTIALTGCGPDYSPNTYNGSAMQQANKVDTGIVIGFREVRISDDGTVGAVTGGAAGGILGAQSSSPTVPTALMALGGTVIGSAVGAGIQHATGDTTGWEYIVREPKGDLISVTQREPKPIPIGQRVLVIEGKQARIVPDYATYDTPPAPKAEEKHDQDKAATTNSASATAATSATPAAAPAQPTPSAPASSAATASPAAPAPDNAASTAPIPLAGDKGQTPSDQPAPTASAPPPAAPPPAAAQTAPPPAADPPLPPASAGSNSNPPAPPPS